MDILVATLALLLTGGALVYGCATIPPGALIRWAVYGGGGIIATQLGWLPLLAVLGFPTPTTLDQYVAAGLMTIGLKAVMESVLPRLLWAEVEESEESDD
jgi:hypothetical protein